MTQLLKRDSFHFKQNKQLYTSKALIKIYNRLLFNKL